VLADESRALLVAVDSISRCLACVLVTEMTKDLGDTWHEKHTARAAW
jgi:hypothetical protein